MTKWWAVILIGIFGGAFCGIFVVFLPLIANWSQLVGYADFGVQVLRLVFWGVLFGSVFGVLAFPLCYAIFLRNTPPRIYLPVTILATMIVAFLAWLVPGYAALVAQVPAPWGSALEIFGGAFIGLLASSFVLSRYYRPTRQQTT